MPPRKRLNKKKDKRNAYKILQCQEWRDVVDWWLSGKHIAWIAAYLGREETAISTMLFSKIPRNYTEEGRRTAPIKMLGTKGIVSILNKNREPTNRDLEYLQELRDCKRTEEECRLILNLSITKIKKVQHRSGLPKAGPDVLF